jgi:hypothetical protein
MFAIIRWTHLKAKCSLASIAIALAATWGIWGGQFNHGQMNVIVMSGLLCFWDPELPKASTWRTIGLVYASTAKIITAYPLLYFARTFRRDRRSWLKPAAIGAVVFAVLSLPSILTMSPPGISSLLAGWRAVAGSAVQGFGPEFARGRMNQGLPVLIGRLWDFRSMSDATEEIGVLLFGTVIALWWFRAAKRLTPAEAWSGWVAWICVVGPLAWSHNFVLALPLLALSIDRVWASGRRDLLVWVALGLFFTGPLTFNLARGIGALLGNETSLIAYSDFIEHMSIKSIGLLVSAQAFLTARSGHFRAATPVVRR